MSKLEEFLDDNISKNESYGTSLKWHITRLQAICDFDTIMEMSADKLLELLVEVHPTNSRAITGYLNALRRYAEYVGNQKFIAVSKQIKVKEIWNKCSGTIQQQRKFVSHSEFQSLISNLQDEDVMNVDYYVALLQAIYEGIYSDDLTALSNLRGQDIHDNVVIVRCDGKEPFELEISHDLVEKLKDMADLRIWEKKNRCGEFSIPIEGECYDSCFKVENRNNIPNRSYRHCYYRYIRKVAELVELDYQLRAKNLYISGIMHRVKIQLEEKGMTLEQAFAFNRRWGEDVDIVRKELERVHYPYFYRNFTSLVTGYIGDFQD